MNQTSDGGLLQAYRLTGDQAAFAELLRRHGGMVLSAARAVIAETSLAEDIVQSTFLTLVRKAATHHGADSLGGWLHRVATCLARDERRKDQRRAAREKEAVMLSAQSEVGPSPSATTLAVLHEELGNLAERYRAPLVLHHLEGRSYDEAAAALGCNRNAFGVRLNRAREQLRKRLVARGVTLGADGIGGVLEESATAAVLPAALVAATCQAASLVAAGKTLTGSGLVSAKVAYLTKSALKTLFWAKVKTVAAICAVALTAGAAVGGGLVAHHALAHRPPTPAGAPRPAAVAPTAGMAPIPGGTNAGTDPDTQKPYSLTVAPFLMDRCEVTKALWDEVAAWGRDHGYRFTAGAGQGKAPDHPVQSVSWYDCLTWCNTRSEKDGFAPVYHADAAGTVVRRGDGPGPYVKATADGYRLPTLVEWQYAARGGEPSHRFPWHDAETIDHSRANYRSNARYSFDTSPTHGFHPTYAVDPQPYTSPVGVFPPNAYGLYDLAGNVSEWYFDEERVPVDILAPWVRHVGGAWSQPPFVWLAGKELPQDRNDSVGVRTVRTPRATAKVSPSP